MGLLSLGVKVEGTEKAKGKLRGLGASFGGIAKGMAAAGAAAAMFGRTLSSALNRSVGVERTREAFNNLGLGVGNAEQSLAGFVNKQDLMQARLRSYQLGLNITAEQFDKLSVSAAKAGITMGQDVKQSINDIMVGMGRQSRLILDNLGVIVRVDKAYKDYAKTLKRSVDSLSEAEKKQAFMAAAMEGLEKAADGVSLEVRSAAEAFVVFKAVLSDATDEIVIALSQNDMLKDSIINVTKAVGEFRDVQAMANKAGEFGKLAMKEKAAVQSLTSALIGLGITDEEVHKQAIRTMKNHGDGYASLLGFLDKHIEKQGKVKGDLETIVHAAGQAAKAFLGWTPAAPAVGAIGAALLKVEGVDIRPVTMTMGALKEMALGAAVELRQANEALVEMQKAGKTPKGFGVPTLRREDTADALRRMEEMREAMNKKGKAQRKLNEAAKIAEANARAMAQLHKLTLKNQHDELIAAESNIFVKERLAVQKRVEITDLEIEEKLRKLVKAGVIESTIERLREQMVLESSIAARGALADIMERESMLRSQAIIDILAATASNNKANNAQEKANALQKAFRDLFSGDKEKIAQAESVARISMMTAEQEHLVRMKAGWDEEQSLHRKSLAGQRAIDDQIRAGKALRQDAADQAIKHANTAVSASKTLAFSMMDSEQTISSFQSTEAQKRLRIDLQHEKNRINSTIKGTRQRKKAIAKAEHETAIQVAKIQHQALVREKKIQGTKSKINALIEAAKSIAAYTSGNIPEAIGHAAAAAAFLNAARVAGATVPAFQEPAARTPVSREGGDKEEIVARTININVSPGGIASAEQTGAVFKEIISAADAVGRGPGMGGEARVMG